MPDLGICCLLVNIVVTEDLESAFYCYLHVTIGYRDLEMRRSRLEVPVLHIPKEKTSIGTTRLHWRLSMFVAGSHKSPSCEGVAVLDLRDAIVFVF